MEKLLSIIFMIGILLLVLPGFLQSNSQLKQFLKNLSVGNYNTYNYDDYFYI